jgi:hypothetical protein
MRYRSLVVPALQRAIVVVWLRERPLGRAAGAFLEPVRGSAKGAG